MNTKRLALSAHSATKRGYYTAVATTLALAMPAISSAAITSVNLNLYQHSGTHALPVGPISNPFAREASAITYNWDTNTLFVLGDEGDALIEVTKTGTLIGNKMTLTGFDDTEALTYIGGGQFVIAEERLRDVYKLSYSAGGTVDRSALPSADLGPTVGNTGIEGISYDPRGAGTFVSVKEKTPQEANSNVISFAGSPTITSLFTPSLGVADLSDVQTLSAVPSLIGTADEDNLLILSQESKMLLEVTRSGTILSQFNLNFLSSSIEGVTIDPTNGHIYLVAEENFAGANGTPQLFVLTPVPLPPAVLLFGTGAALLGRFTARRAR